MKKFGADRLTTSLELAHRIAALAAEKLAADIVILDMRDVVTYTDYFVICSGRTARQTQAVAAEIREALPTSAALSTLWVAIDRLGLTVKKTVHAAEQRRPDVAAARRQWQTWQPRRDLRQCVFLDECGVTTDLLRRDGRRP